MMGIMIHVADKISNSYTFLVIKSDRVKYKKDNEQVLGAFLLRLHITSPQWFSEKQHEDSIQLPNDVL